MIWHLLKRLLIFPKGLLGGLIAATLLKGDRHFLLQLARDQER
jgi:hypothetical protein